jgi:alkylation response protein AidB-like acyl-CoA dehydrogenase
MPCAVEVGNRSKRPARSRIIIPPRAIERAQFGQAPLGLVGCILTSDGALETIQCLGGNGYINDFPAGRLLRDAKLYEIGAGTSEIRRMLIGREIYEKTR